MLANFYNSPPTSGDLSSQIKKLKENYKDLKVFPIGKSVCGQPIEALAIGNPMCATVFVGATHGMEWITTLILIQFCENLLEAIKTNGKVSEINVRKAMKDRSLVIIPCLNPDGVDMQISGGKYAAWQANANGVDINHNFDAGWCSLRKMELESGITGPSATRYGGEHPNSEPETQAITMYCLTYQPKALYSFHSQGEEIYYKYGDNTPERSRLMAQILGISSGYTVTEPTGLASHGGLKDWFIDKFCRPGFTIEVGVGKNPLPIEQFEGIYKKIEEMLIIASLL